MEFRFSKHAIDVMHNRKIKREWVEIALQKPSLIHEIACNEFHYFALINENEKRCLKVVFNPVSQIVVTVYFDRNMRKKGCR